MFKVLVLVAAFSASLGAPELGAKMGSSAADTTRVWWDRGGMAGDDFIVWKRADVVGDGRYKDIGHRGQRNHDDIEEPIFSFRELNETSGNPALAEPTLFEFIWDDRRSINWNDGSVWRPQCPTGYVSTGDLFYGANHISAPGQDLAHRARCVRMDLTAVCGITSKIWDDSGSLASQDVSVWNTAPGRTELGGFLYANNDHKVPPAIEGRCLLKTAYVEE